MQLVFDYFRERTPRSYVEVRETSLVWNYKYAGSYSMNSCVLSLSYEAFALFTTQRTSYFLNNPNC